MLLCFGGYSPYPLIDWVRQVPGFSSLRVPGRYSMLFTFCIAVLAAYGADWLCKNLRPDVRTAHWHWKARISRSLSVNGFAVYLVGLLASMAFVVWWLLSFRIWIEKEPWAAKRFIETSYLSLRSDKPWLTSDMVLSFLNYSLDPTNPKTTISLALMLATFVLLFCWFAFRRGWRLWASLLVLLVAGDMMLFALDFHPTVHINQLSNPDSAARWLMAQNLDDSSRVYTRKDVRKTEANKLLPFQVADITGYSSLETQRHQEYMGKLAEFEQGLLDLYGVRFVVLPKKITALPSYEYTSYNPNRPLADGPKNNRSAHVTYYMNPPVKADEVSLISSLRSAADIPQDAEVADVVVVDTNGERVTLKVKAGRDTAEWAWDRPDVRPHVGHQQPKVADKIWASDTEGRRYQANLYYGNLKLDKTRTVQRIEFHYNYPKGSMRLFGMMLLERPNTAHQVLGRDRLIPRYEDDEVQILENPARLPRTYLVPTARVMKRGDILDTMANGDFDSQRVVLLESERKSSNPLPDAGIADATEIDRWLKGNSDTMAGSARILSDSSNEVAIQTESDRDSMLFLADSYYPGWKALVDGQEQRVYRADYLFRAVQVPKGKHEVRFVFEPASFDLGRDISLYTLGVLLVVLTGLLSAPLLAMLWRRLRRPRRR
ncbi:MAG TPA: YfhO family protein [Chloroflexota bacterium]|nr:YfhO family protein [Chloroflexota bacterium]